MANTIGMNYSLFYKNTQVARRDTGTEKNSKSVNDAKSSSAQYGKNFQVELSGEGMAALANLKNQSVQNDEDTGAMQADEKKLSAKAQAYLDKLREKYGDYDFIISDDVSNPQELTKNSTKAYSVILSNDELERMADDEEYADKIMGKVGDAVDMTKRLEEKLEDGVQFSHIAISFDDDGNTKLFAQLEKMTEQQQERLEAAKEKREEEKAEAEEKEKQAENYPVKRFSVEATSEEELLEKILGIDWENIKAE